MTSREELIKAADEALGPLWLGNTAELDEAVRGVVDAVEPIIRAERDQQWIERLAALCDDDWLRKRDRCMKLDGCHSRRARNPAGAWEHAAHELRMVLNEYGGYDSDDVNRHDNYMAWVNGDRDRGEEARKSGGSEAS